MTSKYTIKFGDTYYGQIDQIDQKLTITNKEKHHVVSGTRESTGLKIMECGLKATITKIGHRTYRIVDMNAVHSENSKVDAWGNGYRIYDWIIEKLMVDMNKNGNGWSMVAKENTPWKIDPILLLFLGAYEKMGDGKI